MKYLLPTLVVVAFAVGYYGVDPWLLVGGGLVEIFVGFLVLWAYACVVVLVVALVVFALLALAELLDQIGRSLR